MAKQGPNQPNQPNHPDSTPLNLNPNPTTAADSATAGGDEAVFIQLTKDGLIELLREARRDPDKEEALIAEKARVRRRREMMVRIARQDERAKAARQANCRHTKPNGEPCVGGQAHSDGRVRIICLRCQKPIREYWSPEVAQGMAIARRMEELGITDADVTEAMEIKGEGHPNMDMPDDFALGMPRGNFAPDLTTENL